MANTPSAQDKRAALQKQIESLQEQVEVLNQEASHELKLKISDARKVVRALEEQLEELTGRPGTNGANGSARRTRRPSITDEALQPLLLKAMADHGREGMNAKQLAEKLDQDALRIRKFITNNPKLLKRQGNGPGTKFFLK